MNDSPETRALYKQVLLARSTLNRVKMQKEVEGLRASLRWTRVASTAAGQAARMFSVGSRAVLYSRLAASAINMLRRK